jgi:GH35 family endo-1,4-beta-xylanase
MITKREKDRFAFEKARDHKNNAENINDDFSDIGKNSKRQGVEKMLLGILPQKAPKNYYFFLS